MIYIYPTIARFGGVCVCASAARCPVYVSGISIPVYFQFGNIVVVDGDQIGVIVKTWGGYSYDVYVRSENRIREFKEAGIDHFVYSKQLSEDEVRFYE